MEDPRQEAETLLREILQPHRGADLMPLIAVYHPPAACVRCSRPIPPGVLLLQPMATHCHYCRAGRRY